MLLLVAFLACVLKKPELDDDDAKEDVNQVLAENEINERKRDITSLSRKIRVVCQYLAICHISL